MPETRASDILRSSSIIRTFDEVDGIVAVGGPHYSRYSMARYGSRHGLRCGLPLLALAVTAAYFVVALFFPILMRLLPGAPAPTEEAPKSIHD